MRYLVLGGAGVVGSHLCDRLLAAGHEVIAVDDLSSGSFANVAHLKREPRFVFVEHDVVDAFRARIDAVFHLALPSTRARCESDPVRAAVTCVTGTMHALDTAAANGARLVLGTSAERWGHGVRSAESLAMDDARARNLDVRVVRIPSTYGPRMAPDGDSVVTRLALAALRGETPDIAVRADQRLLRLVYVDDAVETLVRTMDCAVHTPPLVAPSVETTVMSLAEVVAFSLGAGSPARVVGPSPFLAPPSERRPTPTIDGALPAPLVLGAMPGVALGEGIRRSLVWFAQRMALLFDEPARAELARRTARLAYGSTAPIDGGLERALSQ